jgi:hypothetical protein
MEQCEAAARPERQVVTRSVVRASQAQQRKLGIACREKCEMGYSINFDQLRHNDANQYAS